MTSLSLFIYFPFCFFIVLSVFFAPPFFIYYDLFYNTLIALHECNPLHFFISLPSRIANPIFTFTFAALHRLGFNYALECAIGHVTFILGSHLMTANQVIQILLQL